METTTAAGTKTKQQHVIIESLLAFNFNDTLDKSTQLIEKRPTHEHTFKVGTKVLNTIVSTFQKREHIKGSYEIFAKWFSFCVDFEQKLLTRNNIIYYAIMYTKNLITEHIYGPGIIMLNTLQKMYTFLPDMSDEPENERYLKYLAPLSYNSSLRKELIAENANTAMELFVHGLQFYLKLLSSYFVILDSMRGFEVQLVKSDRVEQFYTNMFEFLKNSLDGEKSEVSISSKKSTKAGQEAVTKYGYLFKFYVSLLMQYVMICFNAQLKKRNETLTTELACIRAYFKKDRFAYFKTECTKKELEELKHSPKLFDINELILKYANQFQKDAKTTKKISAAVLNENKCIEKELMSAFQEIYSQSIDSSCFHHLSTLTSLFEIIYSMSMNSLSDPAIVNKYLQESMIECFVTILIMYAGTVKKLYVVHHQQDKVSKNLMLRPLQFFNLCEKMIEASVKHSKTAKFLQTCEGKEMCENLINSHNSYLKWLNEFKLIPIDDLIKYYNVFEGQVIRLCTQFYTEDISLNYIHFQRISLQTSIEKLKFQLRIPNKNFVSDPSVLKQFHNVCENLLLSYRLKEQFEEALNTIKITYTFLAKFDLDLMELEWVVTNWCKIKRDLWKVNSTIYQKTTIADYLSIRKDHVDKFLLQEIRIYNYFKTIDGSVLMNDEIYYTLEKLDGLNTQNSLLKCRIFLEIAQFTWLNYKGDCKFKLSSEEYIQKAQKNLVRHDCLSGTDLNNSENGNKENNDENDVSMSPLSSPKNTSNNSLILSPTENLQSSRRQPSTRSSKLNRAKNVKGTKSPMVGNRASSKTSTVSGNACNCITSKLITFQLDLYRMLAEYAKQRTKNCQYVNNLVQSRMKIKETNVTTNTDSLHLQTASNLICPEICNESEIKMDDSLLIQKLDECFVSLEYLVSSVAVKESFVKEEKSLKKQFYESTDLLAQLYGFFGILKQRIKVFNMKLELLNYDVEKGTTATNSEFDCIYTGTLLHLMKALLNASMFNEFIGLVFDNKFRATKCGANDSSPSSAEIRISYQNIEELNNHNKSISSKPETLIAYHLALAHYFVLKHQSDDAIKLMKNKIEPSSVMNGKQTAYHYEIKYYLKYLQFMLAMSNVGKSETRFKQLISKETPLSLLEECYVSVFSVARYYVQNSVEPSRGFGTTSSEKGVKEPKQPEENIFFDIGNSECYRILSESLDIMQEMCKYYIEISRYRDALGYIREGLDITQLHFSSRRITQFLLHQINADLIASNLGESKNRLRITENFINGCDSVKKTDLRNFTEINLNDVFGLKNMIYFNNMKMLNDIKTMEAQNSDVTITDDKLSMEKAPIKLEPSDLCKRLNVINMGFAEFKFLNDYCADLQVDAYFIVLNYLKQFKLTSEMKSLVKQLKAVLIKKSSESGSRSNLIHENWNMAEFYCLVYEIDSNVTGLNLAYSAIKFNPHPTLYRRICFHLFQTENTNQRLKIEYLLETQSIALRHKACSIQIKSKRKLNINEEMFNKITQSLSFGTKDTITELEELLPTNVVVTGLILPDMNTLCVVRIEKGFEPILYKVKYDQKYSEEFKEIIAENDRSMKQSERLKFWTTRNVLNQRLISFSEELDKKVLSYAKGLLLGSFTEVDIERLIDRIAKKSSIGKLTKEQRSLIRMLLIGLEHLEDQEVKEALATQFEDDSLARFINEYKLSLTDLPRKHVCLLVDKHIHQIPWECLPSTKKQTISRMPSVHFLLSHLQTNNFKINKDNAYYIVDPGGDLTYTKQKFQPFFERKKHWKGIIGIAPDESQFKKALTEYDIFIYTGHGSGSQYYPSDEVQKIRIQACSILMGCSSGNQYVLGDFEPYGTILAYIIAGCPCVVGNLWDVTDRDIDRLTEDFLESWLKEKDDEKEQKENLICAYLNKSRLACKMTHLNGSAPIVYGLPVSFK